MKRLVEVRTYTFRFRPKKKPRVAPLLINGTAAPDASALSRLTPREREVLQLMHKLQWPSVAERITSAVRESLNSLEA